MVVALPQHQEVGNATVIVVGGSGGGGKKMLVVVAVVAKKLSACVMGSSLPDFFK